MEMCRDCHVKPAVWFDHPPEECDEDTCDCCPQCDECLHYYLHLLEWIKFSKN